jgi:hypothetical protein
VGHTIAPYSLGKLIDWKLDNSYYDGVVFYLYTPYSLGKLIDWKRIDNDITPFNGFISLLVREIN